MHYIIYASFPRRAHNLAGERDMEANSVKSTKIDVKQVVSENTNKKLTKSRPQGLKRRLQKKIIAVLGLKFVW